MKKTRYVPGEVDQFPQTPGVYLFYSADDHLIYVGKAKNLRKRVQSYFRPQAKSAQIKVRKMVEKIKSIAFVLVNSEYEALLLENNLIKSHQPRYNILLKDGKTYPYLCLLDEPFPRLEVRRDRKKKGQYFGPFTSTGHLQMIQELIQSLYPLRTCRYDLSDAAIAKKKYKVCLEYHLGNCHAPCVGKESKENYAQYIEQVRHFLKGHYGAVKKYLHQKAQKAAENKNFLGAQRYKEKWLAVERYQAKSLIVHPTLGDVDVITISDQEKEAFVHYFSLKGGSIYFAQTRHITKKMDESKENMLALAFCYFRTLAQSTAPLLLSPIEFSPLPEGVALVCPKIGDKKKLIDLAQKNVLFYQREYLNKKHTQPRPKKTILMRLQEALHLEKIPFHIDCFDNSNWQGSHPVAAMVTFKKGQPAKKYYRHFHIKSVSGIDDCASMREVVERHYRRQIESHAALPDLVLIDGGKGQLGAAFSALKALGIEKKVALIAIAKRLEEIYRVGDPHPLGLSKSSPALQLLQKIRNAVHDFAVGFHRTVRDKPLFMSELTAIPGIGPKSLEQLVGHFGSLAEVEKQEEKSIAALVGMKKAHLIYTYFQEKKKNKGKKL